MARGVKMERKPKVTPHQTKEALHPRKGGEPPQDIAMNFKVSDTPISRLSPQEFKLTEDEIALAEELERIFMPLAHRKRMKIRQEGGRFVHYTSAENAVNIIRSKKIWMRNVRCMNDYLESYHGYQHLLEMLSNKDIKKEYISVLDELGPNSQ